VWFWQRWRQERDRTRRAQRYVRELQREPDPAAVQWLARHGANGDVDHAKWELRYARRALGLIAAERDALDDGTASLVSAALAASLRDDPAIPAPSLERVERQLSARVRSYSEALATRRAGVAATSQLGTALLAFAGTGTDAYGSAVDGAAELMRRYLDEANGALLDCFGAAALPEDEPPSVLAARARPPA
jgi:alkylhydroperoxidase/carboxymuconolactone decarboxylase family protein YurZ